mgnify:CR=1 FL=1
MTNIPEDIASIAFRKALKIDVSECTYSPSETKLGQQDLIHFCQRLSNHLQRQIITERVALILLILALISLLAYEAITNFPVNQVTAILIGGNGFCFLILLSNQIKIKRRLVAFIRTENLEVWNTKNLYCKFAKRRGVFCIVFKTIFHDLNHIPDEYLEKQDDGNLCMKFHCLRFIRNNRRAKNFFDSR